MNYNFDRQSDSETIQQTQTIQQPIVTLQYLLNENKMKEIALSKATHLIELYKIELQVKEQDYLRELEIIKQSEKDNYEAIITQLQEKILDLQRQLRNQQIKFKENQHLMKEKEKYIREQEFKIKQLEKKSTQFLETNKFIQNESKVPKMNRNNSGKDLSINRKERYSQGKPSVSQNKQSITKQTGFNQGQSVRKGSSILIYNNDAGKQYQIYRVEKTFLIDFLLKNEEKDESIIDELLKSIQSQPQLVSQWKSSMRENEKYLDTFIKFLREPSIELQKKIKHQQQVTKIQELIIEELNGQLNDYQNLFQLTNSSLIEIFQQNYSDSFNTQKNYQFQNCRQAIDEIHLRSLSKIKNHKNFIKQKVHNMEAQNKELKRILEDMIKLIKNNQKIHSLTLTHQKLTSFTTKNQNQSASTNKNQNLSEFTNKNSRPSHYQSTKISSFGFGEEKTSFGNFRNIKTIQDFSLSKQKARSQVLHKK